MKDAIVKNIRETSFSIEDVLQLVLSSFDSWKEKGLNTAVARLDIDSFKEKIANSIVLVCYSESTTTLHGTISLDLKQETGGGKFLYDKYLAVSPLAKGQGIGKKLLQRSIQLAKQNHCQYLADDTSVKATWSVAWHKKCGYRIVGMRSFSTNNYYSYLFRLQLEPTSKWNNKYYCAYRFVRSFVWCLLTRTADGKDRYWYSILKKE